MKKLGRMVVACAFLLMVSAPRSHAAEAEFDVVLVPISATSWAATKYNTETGEAWAAQDGKWLKIEDETPVPKGRYTVKMTGLSNDWASLRLEVHSGRVWQCREGKWVEITEKARVSEDASVAPSAAVPPPATSPGQ